MFEILENQRMLEGNVNVTLIPPDLARRRADPISHRRSGGPGRREVSPGAPEIPPPVPGQS